LGTFLIKFNEFSEATNVNEYGRMFYVPCATRSKSMNVATAVAKGEGPKNPQIMIHI